MLSDAALTAAGNPLPLDRPAAAYTSISHPLSTLVYTDSPCQCSSPSSAASLPPSRDIQQPISACWRFSTHSEESFQCGCSYWSRKSPTGRACTRSSTTEATADDKDATMAPDVCAVESVHMPGTAINRMLRRASRVDYACLWLSHRMPCTWTAIYCRARQYRILRWSTR